uniref:N-acetyltransferase domain-containing protein n=1 Tax=viral metagenome TaxID=1070528 RepID=A0A6M3KGF0_9ZZZZ
MLKSVPTTLAEANAFVGEVHRHHDEVVGHRFSFGAEVDGKLVGTVICGRPVAPKTEQYKILEVTRLCTDGTDNACSFLYGAAAKIGKIMGFKRVQTFILPTESGVSLKAAGWVFDGVCEKSGRGFQSRPGRKGDSHGPKHRWIKELNP